MTLSIAILVVFLILILIWLLLASQDRERGRWERERKSLLDRIQHPERIQVEPGAQVEFEPSKDEAELAYIGQVVPDGVQVGTDVG